MDPTFLETWLLRSTLPTEFCFDGIRQEFHRVEDQSSLQLLCTIWYLIDGDNPAAALQYHAQSEGDDICYEYSIVPETAYRSYDQLWKHFYLYATGEVSDWTWPESRTGSIVWGSGG